MGGESPAVDGWTAEMYEELGYSADSANGWVKLAAMITLGKPADDARKRLDIYQGSLRQRMDMQ